MLTNYSGSIDTANKNYPSENIEQWSINKDVYKQELSKHKLLLEQFLDMDVSKLMEDRIGIILGHINCQLGTWKNIKVNLLSYQQFLAQHSLPWNYQRKKMMEEEYLDFEIRTFDDKLKILKQSIESLQNDLSIPRS